MNTALVLLRHLAAQGVTPNPTFAMVFFWAAVVCFGIGALRAFLFSGDKPPAISRLDWACAGFLFTILWLGFAA